MTCGKVQIRTPVGQKLFSSPGEGPGGPCSLLYNGCRMFFSGVRWKGGGLENSPSLSLSVTMDTATNLPPSCAANIFKYQWTAYDRNNYYHSVSFVMKTGCKILNPINLTYCACSSLQANGTRYSFISKASVG